MDNISDHEVRNLSSFMQRHMFCGHPTHIRNDAQLHHRDKRLRDVTDVYIILYLEFVSILIVLYIESWVCHRRLWKLLESTSTVVILCIAFI